MRAINRISGAVILGFGLYSMGAIVTGGRTAATATCRLFRDSAAGTVGPHAIMLPLYDLNPHRRTPVVVVSLIVANLALLLVEMAQGSEAALGHFVHTWGLTPRSLWQLDAHVWLTPLTSMFLHGGWAHVLGNCWFLWLFGNNVEDRLGHGRFVFFYICAGLGATALQVAVAPTSTVVMIGASGAISGVLGAYIRFFPMTPILTLVPFIVPIMPIPAFFFLLHWFAFQFWQGVGSIASTGVTGGVAWWAHIGGFAVGFLLAGSLRLRGRR